jgi:hypothetical protein
MNLNETDKTANCKTGPTGRILQEETILNIYTTLADIRRHLGLSSTQTDDDDLLLSLLGAAARLIDAYTGRRFYPVRETHTYTCDDPGLLLLRDDLLTLHSLTNGDGSALSSAVYHLHPSALAVKSSLVLDRTQAVFTHDGDPVDAISVDGTWGYHPDWPNAWASSGDSVQDNPLSSSATFITVTDADAPESTGYGQRFAVGQLLRIESESVHVLAVDTTQNKLTVARGVNGTTAASHVKNTVIDIYRPPEDVRQVCLRVATWLYKQQDTGFSLAAGSLHGQMIVPAALPDDVQQVLTPYRRVQVG